MNISKEGLLTQLGYNVDDIHLKQLQAIQKHTAGFEQIQKHIITLNDHLKHYGGFVAISNTHPYLKIKLEYTNPSQKEAALATIKKWAEKYKVILEKAPNKDTFYIKGIAVR
ncbi:MAG: hypothetical protein GXO61_03980 [Epsilonproteobacteria bacterium]|jgi:phosphomannomutase|nr:hypothetical protein [Campylobacterota bacterium]